MLVLRNWIRTPAKAEREYRWGRSCPREPRPTMLLRASVNLDMTPRKWEHSIDGRSASTKEAKEAAKGKAKVGKEMEGAKEEPEL